MDVVTFNNKEYTKASVLAKRFRYTPDYLGQLCRTRKVDARLVGRSWYVQLGSLEQHRKTRYKATEKDAQSSLRTAEISSKKAINNYLSRVDVQPVLKQKTVRIILSEYGKSVERSVRYENDDHALIPRVDKSNFVKEIHVLPAGAKMLSVQKKNENVISFKADPLPEVSLRGSLPVQDIVDTVFEDAGQTIEPESKSVESLSPSTPRKLQIKKTQTNILGVEGPARVSRTKNGIKATSATLHAKGRFSPASVSKQITTPVLVPHKKTPYLFSLLVSFSFSIIVAGGVLSVVSYTVVFDGRHNDSVIFDFEQITTLVRDQF